MTWTWKLWQTLQCGSPKMLECTTSPRKLCRFYIHHWPDTSAHTDTHLRHSRHPPPPDKHRHVKVRQYCWNRQLGLWRGQYICMRNVCYIFILEKNVYYLYPAGILLYFWRKCVLFISYYNQNQFLTSPESFLHSGGVWFDSGDVTLTREMWGAWGGFHVSRVQKPNWTNVSRVPQNQTTNNVSRVQPPNYTNMSRVLKPYHLNVSRVSKPNHRNTSRVSNTIESIHFRSTQNHRIS